MGIQQVTEIDVGREDDLQRRLLIENMQGCGYEPLGILLDPREQDRPLTRYRGIARIRGRTRPFQKRY